MDTSANGLNVKFPIYKADGTSFEDLVLHKSAFESVVMSLGDKITGDVYYKNNSLAVTMQEYIVYEGVHYVLVNPPTIVREGLVKDNSEAKGLTKYSFTFYHPMYMLGNFEFTDVAVTDSEERYLAQNKTFSWIGYLRDFVDKLNANLTHTQWIVRSNVSVEDDKLSEVLSFDNNFVSDALKTAYETWEKPFTIQRITSGEDYNNGKRFAIVFGMPDEMVMVDGEEYTFRLGQGVGLKNNSRTPKNNKIVTRISGYGSENNIPWGYPQIVWTGDQTWDYTINNDKDNPLSYPIYNGIVNGQQVRLIKHPFTRNHLMPSVYRETVDKKVNPLNPNYNPQTPIIDYYDADGIFPNPCDPTAPSYEIHQFEDIKPELGNNTTLAANAVPYTTSTEGGYVTISDFNTFIGQTMNASTIAQEKDVLSTLVPLPQEDKTEEGVGGAYTYKYEVKYIDGYFLTVKYESSGVNFTKKVLYANEAPTPAWDDTMDDDGNYAQSYFKVTLPTLAFDLYACASITEEMKINMRSGACIGCTFPIMVDWEDYKKNFYDSDGNFDPTIGEGHPRNADKYPDSSQGSITVICQKEYETFGTIMPNVYQQPKQGDIIVFLGISLPQSYIEDAEERLDEASIEYMLENNVPLYEYPLKFDEYFLKNNLNILEQIHNNTRIKFQFGGESTMALFVKQINIKWGDNILPQYDITLADDIEVVLNQIGQVTEDVSALRVQMSEMQKYYAQNLINDISSRLSRIQDDIALGKITFQQGLESIGSLILHSDIRSSNYIQGMTVQGRGWRIDELGNAEVESIRVRSFMEVMELLVNRLQAQEGDTMFSDNDQIDYVESIEYNGTMYYRLTFKEKWAGYFTSQVEGNILRGIANTLAAKLAHVSEVEDTEDTEHDGRNSYFTSWMQVVAIPNGSGITLGNNQVLVVLYGDNQVPSGTNFEPCELMTVARWGSILDPNDPTINPEEEGITQEEKDRRLGEVARRKALQSSFYISTTEGRIVKLTGVNTPILKDGNYGTTLGELPDFVKNYEGIKDRIAKGGDYLYAQGVVVGDFIKIDKVGNPIINYVDKGEWQDNTPYLFGEFNEVTLQYETHEVWHNGALWRVKQHQPVTQGGVDTYYEPTDNNSAYWQKLMASGDSTRQIYSYSSNAPVVPQGYDQDDEYTPSGWSSTPLSLSQEHKDVYISTRKKHNGTWRQWSTPVLFSHLAEDGTSIAIKGSAYSVITSSSELPSQPSFDTICLWNNTNDDDYEQYVLYDYQQLLYRWEGFGCDVGDGFIINGDLWVKTTDTPTADNQRWVNVGRIKGDKGDDGKNTATVFIYKRANAISPTDYPQNVITYNFSDGSLSGLTGGWNDHTPTGNTPCWVRQVFVQSDQSTATIDPSEWGTAYKLVEDGNGIVSITNTYAVSTQGTTTSDTTSPTIQGSWSAAQPMVSDAYPYLWKKEVTVYTDTSKNTTKYYCMGKKGDKGTDAPQVMPNMLLRTVFDNGLDFIMEKWGVTDDDGIEMDSSQDTQYIEGRQSIRLSSSNIEADVAFYQSVLGKIKANTWYAMSFNSFSSRSFVFYIHNIINGVYTPIYSELIVDGVVQTIDPNNTHNDVGFTSDWDGARHSIVFKTNSSISSQHLVVGFHLPYESSIITPQALVLCMPKLEEGNVATAYMANENDLIGAQGERGKIGKNYYYGGDFNASDNPTQFSVTNYETPFFTYNNNKWVWVGANGTYTMAQMGTPSSSNANFEIMVTDFKYLISEALFSAFAKLGSFIISGDWMISQNGTVNGVASTDYNLFDPLHPIDNTGNNFIPSYAVDGLTGKAYINDANVAGTVYADKGEFQGLMQNSMYSPWHDLADIQDKSYDNNVITIGDETYKIYTNVKNAGRILRFSSYDFINGTARRASLVLQGNDIDPQTGNPINTEYFYYHGIAIQQLYLNYGEVVELLGIGSSTKFWGWIVLDKKRIRDDEGLPLNVFVKASIRDDGVIYSSAISDSRGLFRVEKVSTGTYRITLPNALCSKRLTIVGGVNSDDKRHVFFSSVKVTTIGDLQYPYFIAETTDMSGNNVDCPFNFYVHDTSTL